MATPSAESQLEFLRNVQALLEDGQFVATYKYALLIALADIAVESGVEDDGELPVSLSRIAEKFVEYYWQQSAPIPGKQGLIELLAAFGQQAAVVKRLIALRCDGIDTLAKLRAYPTTWSETVRDVAQTVRVMPLFRLQTIGGQRRPFLYDNVLVHSTIRLKPGVAFHLRRFHPLITGMARERWLAQVRRIPANRSALGEGEDLEAFLFGATRQPVAHLREMLADAQQGDCLYCGRALHGDQIHVDHFVPWSLLRLDAPTNLVAAHPACNAAKSDALAAEPHVERWVQRNAASPALGAMPTHAVADGRTGPDDVSRPVARWAYERAIDLGQLGWLHGRKRVPIEPTVLALLR